MIRRVIQNVKIVDLLETSLKLLFYHHVENIYNTEIYCNEYMSSLIRDLPENIDLIEKV
ncbi:hypothetical protein ES705_18778 [subsurface metagenome]